MVWGGVSQGLRVGTNVRSRDRLLKGSLTLQIVRFGLPLAIGMVLHTAFNLIDMFMVSRLEEATDALAALRGVRHARRRGDDSQHGRSYDVRAGSPHGSTRFS